MGFALQSSTSGKISRVLSVLAVLSAVAAVAYLLYPDPLADAFFAAIVLLAVVFAFVGAAGAWKNRTSVVWVAALLLTGLSAVGAWSIGAYVTPAAILLLGAAFFSQLAGPPEGFRESIVANPPSASEAILKTLASVGAVAVGGGLLYFGAFAQELFGACAAETLSCAVDEASWGALGLAGLGLLAVVVGGWLLWKQVYIASVLRSSQTR